MIHSFTMRRLCVRTFCHFVLNRETNRTTVETIFILSHLQLPLEKLICLLFALQCVFWYVCERVRAIFSRIRFTHVFQSEIIWLAASRLCIRTWSFKNAMLFAARMHIIAAVSCKRFASSGSLFHWSYILRARGVCDDGVVGIPCAADTQCAVCVQLVHIYIYCIQRLHSSIHTPHVLYVHLAKQRKKENIHSIRVHTRVLWRINESVAMHATFVFYEQTLFSVCVSFFGSLFFSARFHTTVGRFKRFRQSSSS